MLFPSKCACHIVNQQCKRKSLGSRALRWSTHTNTIYWTFLWEEQETIKINREVMHITQFYVLLIFIGYDFHQYTYH